MATKGFGRIKLIRDLLKHFSDLLALSWEKLELLSKCDPTGSLKADWMQVNWELFVEGLLPGKNLTLEPYGDGADCNGASSRVLYPDALPTHRLVCDARKNEPIYDFLSEENLDLSQGGVFFDRFVCIGSDAWYYELPPFDKVLAEYRGREVVLDFEQLDIQLQSIAD